MAVRVPRQLLSRDPAVLAPLAGLRYTPDEPPGWSRRRRGRGFSVLDEQRRTVRGPQRDRVVALAIPPAWTDVWISPAARGHLQATGFDDAGRKQYRYHDDYRSLCELRKYERLRHFGRALPGLRAEIRAALDGPIRSKRLAIAAVLATIDSALLRVGNEESADRGHHGATTLAPDHVDHDGHIVLEFVAKGGKPRTVIVEDERLADVLDDLATGGGERLFTYDDPSGAEREVTAADVNATIASIAGPCFSAKDFRTWGGSRTVLEARIEGLTTLDSLDVAADALGNTRAVARASYVHPEVLEAGDDLLRTIWRSSRRSAAMSRADRALHKLLTRTD